MLLIGRVAADPGTVSPLTHDLYDGKCIKHIYRLVASASCINSFCRQHLHIVGYLVDTFANAYAVVYSACRLKHNKLISPHIFSKYYILCPSKKLNGPRSTSANASHKCRNAVYEILKNGYCCVTTHAHCCVTC